MKKVYRLKKGGKVVFTLILVSLGIVVYHYLGILGAYASKNALAGVFVQLGWLWLLVGGIMVLKTMWEE